MVLFYGCKVTYFFVHMQVCMIFYASWLKKCDTMSRQKVMIVAEAILMNNVKNRFISVLF